MDTQSMDEAKKMLDKFSEDKELSKVESMIVDNKIEFDYKENVYRVRLLKLKEKEELYLLKLSKFGQLIKNKDILMEKDLIKIYAERGININELTDKIRKLDAEMLGLRMLLGEALEKNESTSALKAYEDKIKSLLQTKQLVMIQKINYLSTSLECQMENYEAQFVTYLTLEIMNVNKWEKAFKTWEEFENNEDEQLINLAGTRSMLLQYI